MLKVGDQMQPVMQLKIDEDKGTATLQVGGGGSACVHMHAY